MKDLSSIDDSHLQAEVKQLLLQYKLDNECASPEEGTAQPRLQKESVGPELSSKSAWIATDKYSAGRPQNS